MKTYLVSACILIGLAGSACATKPANLAWNKPLIELANILSMDSKGAQISEVVVSVDNTTSNDFCVFKHAVEGVPSNELSADIIDRKGNRINIIFSEPRVDEPITYTRLEAGEVSEWKLNYSQLFFEGDVFNKKYKFRVIISAAYCDETPILNSDSILISSPFVSIDNLLKN